MRQSLSNFIFVLGREIRKEVLHSRALFWIMRRPLRCACKSLFILVKKWIIWKSILVYLDLDLLILVRPSSMVVNLVVWVHLIVFIFVK